jgi:hypothetical protein
MTTQEPHHSDILEKHLRNEPVEPPDLRGEQRSRRERCPDALVLPVISDHEPNFGGVVTDRDEFAQRHNLGAVIIQLTFEFARVLNDPGVLGCVAH